MSGESRRDRSAYSLIVRDVSVRWIDVKTIGRASVMNPGLLPVLWIDVPPVAQAPRRRPASRDPCCAGWWNSPRVVTTFAPDASSARPRSKSHAAGM